jgi:hypothetical protein
VAGLFVSCLSLQAVAEAFKFVNFRIIKFNKIDKILTCEKSTLIAAAVEGFDAPLFSLPALEAFM